MYLILAVAVFVSGKWPGNVMSVHKLRSARHLSSSAAPSYGTVEVLCHHLFAPLAGPGSNLGCVHDNLWLPSELFPALQQLQI